MSLFSDITTQAIEKNIDSRILQYQTDLNTLIEKYPVGLERSLKAEFLSGCIFAAQEMKKNLVY